MGSLSYEEYFPCDRELRQLAKDEPELYETYRELMCHFYICMDITKTKGNLVGQKTWADYLFLNLSATREEIQIRPAASEAEINKCLLAGRGDVVLTDDVDEYFEGDAFKSFHHQARHPLSKRAALSGFLSI